MAFGKIVRVLLVSAFAASTVLTGSVVRAQEARAVGVTPPRLSFIDGEVSYWRPGADDWAPAQINTALSAGDSLYAGDTGNVEIEIGSRAFIRAGSGTELGIESLETGYLQLRVPAGHAALDLKRLPEGQEIEVDTPNGAFLIEHTGYYRFDVDENATQFAARRGGSARVIQARGEEIQLASGEAVEVSGTETASLQRVTAAADDAWDRWNYDRTGQLAEASRSEQYVAGAVAGVDDLDRYGDWRETPKYGNVWVPRDVGPDWVPYSDGRWVYDGYYGWTWVDYAPWGWAPYHYGRWCWNDGYWGWAPGPVVARPVYSPALVAFFGGGGVGVSVSVGTPFVSWVALGYGEPVVPWWGPRGFVGRPYWGGWGGPRYVNHVHVENTTIINVNNINRYDNFRNGRAVVGIQGDRFGRGDRVQHIRVDQDRLRNLRPIRGEIGVRPTRESLVARPRRATRPPDPIQNPQVVATRAPQDPAQLPRAAGVVRSNDRRPEPRIVSTREGGSGRDLTRGRNQPPPTRLDRDTIRERGQGRIDELRGRDRNEAATRGGEPTNRLDRNQRGDETGIRRGPQPPGANDRIERGRDARGIAPGARGVERNERGPVRGGERATREPTPPSVERMQQRERDQRGGSPEPPQGRGGNDVRGRERTERTREVAPPSFDRGAPGRGSERMPQARERAPEPPRGDRSSSRDERQMREMRQPPVERHAAPRPERQQAPRMERPQRQEPPRMERQSRPEVPRMERREQPRVERQTAPRMERQAAPRMDRQEAPRMERQQQPRMERQQAPRAERGGGGDQRGGGGGGEPRGHGRKRDT
jgi:hypothetical protein